MSKTYSKEQIVQAYLAADEQVAALEESGRLDAWTSTFARVLGVSKDIKLLDRPDPGTWHHVSSDNRLYAGMPAQVNLAGDLQVFYPGGGTEDFAREEEWPDLTPARMISEESYEAWQYNLRRMQDERDSWEEEYEKAVARVVPAEPVELSEEEVGELWDATPGSRGRWREYTGPFQEHVIAVVNAALAKHGK